MRNVSILCSAAVVVASCLGAACTRGDDAQSTFHPTWDDRSTPTSTPASSTDQGAYGGGPKTSDGTPKTDENHGMGGLPSGVTGTGTNIDGTDPAGSHGPQPQSIAPSLGDAGNSSRP